MEKQAAYGQVRSSLRVSRVTETRVFPREPQKTPSAMFATTAQENGICTGSSSQNSSPRSKRSGTAALGEQQSDESVVSEDGSGWSSGSEPGVAGLCGDIIFPCVQQDALALLEEEMDLGELVRCVDDDVTRVFQECATVPRRAAYETAILLWPAIAHLKRDLPAYLRSVGWSRERANHFPEIVAKHCRHAGDGDVGDFVPKVRRAGRSHSRKVSVAVPARVDVRHNPTYEVRGWEHAPPAPRPTLSTLSPKTFRRGGR